MVVIYFFQIPAPQWLSKIHAPDATGIVSRQWLYVALFLRDSQGFVRDSYTPHLQQFQLQ